MLTVIFEAFGWLLMFLGGCVLLFTIFSDQITAWLRKMMQ